MLDTVTAACRTQPSSMVLRLVNVVYAGVLPAHASTIDEGIPKLVVLSPKCAGQGHKENALFSPMHLVRLDLSFFPASEAIPIHLVTVLRSQAIIECLLTHYPHHHYFWYSTLHLPCTLYQLPHSRQLRRPKHHVDYSTFLYQLPGREP